MLKRFNQILKKGGKIVTSNAKGSKGHDLYSH